MREQIKKFITENFLFSGKPLKDEEPLFDSGIIDSLGFIQLLAFIEKAFNVHLDMSEITMEKFSTVKDIEETIKSKMKN